MNIVKSTVKGQILIPVSLRRKYGIGKGTPLQIYDEGSRIIVEPLVEDPVEAGKGMLKTKGRVLRCLLEDRQREARR